MSARIVVISGAPGTGKTSVSRILAENSTYDRAVHIHTDDFYQYIRKGYISPWLDGSGDQNNTMIEAAAASAKRFSAGGYEVFVDGVIGPWFLKPWIQISEEGIDVRYIVLRPSEQTTVLRVNNREQNEYFPLSDEVVKNLWRSFTDLGKYESHVLDTTAQTVVESAAHIQKMLLEENFRLV
jgi:cytidylate kinase